MTPPASGSRDQSDGEIEAAELVRLVGDTSPSDVVFDLDGTLVLLDMPWADWTATIVGHLPESVRGEVGAVMNSPGAAWGAALNAHVRDGTISHQIVVDVSQSFEAQHRGYEPNAALIDVLPTLVSCGCLLHLWTSNVRATAERVLTDLGIQRHFRSIVARDDVVLGKPDLEGWVALGVEAETSLIVGDSQNDERAAEAALTAYYPINHFRTPDRRDRQDDQIVSRSHET